jgi:hypothetical protein
MLPFGLEKNIILIKKILGSNILSTKKAQNLSLDFGLLQFITFIKTRFFIYFNLVVSTLVGVSSPLTMVEELIAIALIISVILFISNVPISSLAL